MNAKKPLPTKQAPVHTIRCGEVVADIHLRQSNSGFSYLDFRLERSYTTSTAKQSRGATFFAKNAQDLSQAAAEAAAWIRTREQTDAQTNGQAGVQ
jgi:hypothetical protein